MGRYVFDLEAIAQIKNACQASSERLDTESQTMRNQLTELEQAIQGIPNLAMADKLEEVRRLLTQLSSSMEESQVYLANVMTQAEDFAHRLQQR